MKNRKIAALALLSVIALTTVVGSFLLTVVNADAEATDGDTLDDSTLPVDGIYHGFMGEMLGDVGPGRLGVRGGLKSGIMGEIAGFGGVELSEEFEQKVTTIAESDSDVQDLLAEGYDIAGIKPVIKRVVDSDGYLTTRASSAIMILEKDVEGASGRAFVLVDVDAAKVTQVTILTKTVIDKS